MKTQSIQATVTQTVPDEILTEFLNPEHPVLKNILTIWNARGDLTETGAQRMRQTLGEEAYAHYNWDTVVATGRILLMLPRFKHPRGEQPPFGFHLPAEWFWCFSQIEDGEDIEPAPYSLIRTVPSELQTDIAMLPGVEWIKINRVNFFSYGNGKATRKHQPPPEGIMFFRFDGGLGLSVAVNSK